MRKIALIPARYAASRFPGKLMQLLGDKTVIRHTYDSTVATGLFDEVAVVCDSQIIFDEITQHGGKAIRSMREHACGTDRIAEAAENLEDFELLVNVQGDEPFTRKAPMEKLLRVFEEANGGQVQVASLMQHLKDPALVSDPNYVKVVTDKNSDALLFSRSVIPYARDKEIKTNYYEHIGIYAFRRKMLLDFAKMPMTPLEAAEKIECLRFLENGIKLRMVATDYMGVEIDTPEDLEKAIQYLNNK